MNLSVKKLLLWVSMLLVIMLLYSVWKLQSTERQLYEFVKKELAPTDSTGGIRLYDVNVRVKNGLLELHGFQYYTSRDSLLFQADRLTLGIGTWKSLQMGLLPAGYVLATVDQTAINVRGFQLENFEPFNAQLELFGRPFDLFPIFAEKRFPGRAIRVEAKATSLPGGLFRPLFEQAGYAQFNADISDIEITASIYPSTGRVAINSLRISGANTPEASGNATIFYDISDASFNAENALLGNARFEGSLSITLPDEGAFSVVPVGQSGTFGFRDANWEFEGNLDSTRIDSPIHFDHHRLRIESPVLYPQPGALGQLGNALILFGIPTQSLPFTLFEAEMNSTAPGVYTISNINLHHVNFQASFDGNLGGGSLNQLMETPVKGVIRLDSMSEDVSLTVLSLERMLGWQLQRDGNAILIPVDFQSGFIGTLP